MPNIYYRPPNAPFASATQGFLGNLKDFTKLGLEKQAVDQRGQQIQQDADAEGRRLRTVAVQEQNAVTRLKRLQLDQEMQAETRRIVGEANDLALDVARKALDDGVMTDDRYKEITKNAQLGNITGKPILEDVRDEVGMSAKKIAEDGEYDAIWRGDPDTETEGVLPRLRKALAPDPDNKNKIEEQLKKEMRIRVREMEGDAYQRLTTDPEGFERGVLEFIGEGAGGPGGGRIQEWLQNFWAESFGSTPPADVHPLLQRLHGSDAPPAVQEQVQTLDSSLEDFINEQRSDIHSGPGSTQAAVDNFMGGAMKDLEE